jgi:hypothetical protein
MLSVGKKAITLNINVLFGRFFCTINANMRFVPIKVYLKYIINKKFSIEYEFNESTLEVF